MIPQHHRNANKEELFDANSLVNPRNTTTIPTYIFTNLMMGLIEKDLIVRKIVTVEEALSFWAQRDHV